MSVKISRSEDWVPSQFLLNDGRAYIEMVRFEQRRLVETFMRFDLQGCRQRTLIDYEDLNEYCDSSRDMSKSVAGMIFHMSRCGSTLTTQMLRHSDAHVVIAEPDVLGQFLQNFRGTESQLVSSLRNLIALLADTLCQPGQKLIIKWSSWNVYVIDAICQAIAGVPLCYQYRAPHEVLVSLSRQRAEWMDLKTVARLHERQGYFSQSSLKNPYLELLESSGGEGVSIEEFSARLIGHCCERALKYSDQMLMIPYDSMPDAVFTHIAPHFSIEMSGVEKSRARIESRWDTKSVKDAKPFESDSRIKKQLATAEILAHVQKHIEPSLSQLIAASKKNFKFETQLSQAERRQANIDSVAIKKEPSSKPSVGLQGKAKNRAQVKWL